MPAPKSTKEGPGVPFDKQEKLHLCAWEPVSIKLMDKTR